jgi:hypothetical protein
MTPSLRLACASLLLLGLAAAPADEPKKAAADLEKLDRKLKEIEQGLDKALARLEALEKKLGAPKAPDEPKPDPRDPVAWAEQVYKDQVAWMNELADALEKDDQEKVKKLDEKGKEIEKRLRELKLSDADRTRLQEKYKGEVFKAFDRLQSARSRGKDRDGPARDRSRDEPKKAALDADQIEKKIKDLAQKLDGARSRLGALEKALAALKGLDAARPDPRTAAGQAELLLRDEIALLGELADAVEKKDAERARNSQMRIEEVERKAFDLRLSDADRKKLEERYKDAFARASREVLAARLYAGEFDLNRGGPELDPLAKKARDLGRDLEKVVGRLDALERELMALKGPDFLKPDSTEALAKAEALIKEQIALVNELADAYEKKDAVRINLLDLRRDELRKRVNALKLAEADQKKLDEKYKAEFDKAILRLTEAARKARETEPKKDGSKKDKN